jgi:DNA-binding GntR family transcriptional regulator
MSIVQRLHQQSDRYLRQLALTHGETRANEEHRAIAAAARAHDTKRACQLVRDHIAGAGRSLLAFLRERRMKTRMAAWRQRQ